MNADEIVMALRKTQEDYKNDFVSTGRISISNMARDCADCIESLQAQLTESQRRERAAIADIKHTCNFCIHYGEDYPDNAPHCDKCMKRNYNGGVYCSGAEWQWRGPQEDELC